MSPSTRTSGSSYGGQSVASGVSQLSHLNPSFSRSTQTYSLPSNKAVFGAQWGAGNSNFGGVPNLNVNLPNPQQNKGKWVASFSAKATLSCPAPAPAPSAGNWVASYSGQSDDCVPANATLSCPAPAPAPSAGKWVASFSGQSDDGVSAKATLSCPAPIPAPAPVLSPSWLKLAVVIQG